jgi:phage-related baseplate assembly protein
VHYFLTDATVVLYAGALSVEVTATAENGGTEYNDIAPGEITNIVDVSDVPLIDYVTNITIAEGGGDREGDEPYRERIREAENRLSTAGPAKAYKYWALTANPLVSDAVVQSETEIITRTLKTYAGHAFQGGANLLPDTLVVYLPDGSEAVAEVDYTATYDDELLTLALTEALADVENVTIKITRNMDGRVEIVPICAGGKIPDKDVLDDVLAVCSADDVKPLTDKVKVRAPDVEYYDIELTYWTTKANESEVVQNVEGSGGAIDQYIYWQGSSLDQDINPDELWKMIVCPHWEENLTGATRAVITKPEYTELPKTTVAKFSGNLKVQHFVKD